MEDSVHTSEVMASIEVPMQFCYTLILGIDIVRRLVQEDVKVLKLTAKEGTSTNELTFDGQTVWEDKKKLCSSAILYMDGEKPTLAVLVTRDNKNNKQGTVYRYHDGKQWKDGKEEDHKKKLEDLKERCKPGEILDIAKPDGSNIDVHTENESEVSFKEYTPKNAFHISSVVDGDKELWKPAEGTNEKCLLAECYEKEPTEVIYLEVESNGTKYKYFERVNGEWNEIIRELFNGKFMTMIGESGKNVYLNITHPNILLCLHESLSATKGSVIVSYLLHG